MLRGFRIRLLAVFSLFVLVIPGCSITPDQIEQSQKQEIHPELPSSLNLKSVDWQVYEIDSSVVIGVPKDEFSSHLENKNELLRFIRESKESLCYYRDDLDEDFCTDNEQ